MRGFGIEEHLLLVDRVTFAASPVAADVLHAAGRRSGGVLGDAVHQEAVRVVSAAHPAAADLLDDVRAGRRAADVAAARVGARVAALATCPLPAVPRPSPTRRAAAMAGAYGAAMPALGCGLTVTVSIESDEEGVQALDRIRTWLPVLVALSANSPFHDGRDTGHASWRSVAAGAWPSAGPAEAFGSFAAYRAYEQRMLAAGVLLDADLIGLPARLGARPVLEVRVADVCADPRSTVTIAALVRALVETASREWRADVAPSGEPAALLRLAAWQAAMTGVHGPLLSPLNGRPTSAGAVVGQLLAHVLPALEQHGDDGFVVEALAGILEDGTGADRQRRALGRRGRLADVVADAIEATHAVPSTQAARDWDAAALRLRA